MVNFKRFDRSDWDAFAGAERWPNGNEPFMATIQVQLVNEPVREGWFIVTTNGVEIGLNEDFDGYGKGLSPCVWAADLDRATNFIIICNTQAVWTPTQLEQYGFEEIG